MHTIGQKSSFFLGFFPGPSRPGGLRISVCQESTYIEMDHAIAAHGPYRTGRRFSLDFEIGGCYILAMRRAYD